MLHTSLPAPPTTTPSHHAANAAATAKRTSPTSHLWLRSDYECGWSQARAQGWQRASSPAQTRATHAPNCEKKKQRRIPIATQENNRSVGFQARRKSYTVTCRCRWSFCAGIDRRFRVGAPSAKPYRRITVASPRSTFQATHSSASDTLHVCTLWPFAHHVAL